MSNLNPNICPICGSPITKGETFCKVCGSEIDAKEQPIESEQPSQPLPHHLRYNYTPWILFGLGFFLGVTSMEAMGDSTSYLGISVESFGSVSIVTPIIFGILALISIGLGGFFLWKNRKSKLIVENSLKETITTANTNSR